MEVEGETKEEGMDENANKQGLRIWRRGVHYHWTKTIGKMNKKLEQVSEIKLNLKKDVDADKEY